MPPPWNSTCVLLHLSALLAVILQVRGQSLDTPSPSSTGFGVRPNATLSWRQRGPNHLPNGGFEDGTNGWSIGSGRIAAATAQNPAAEGSWYLTGTRPNLVWTEVRLPAGPGSLSLTYRVNGQLPESRVAVETLDGSRPRRVLSSGYHWAIGWRNCGIDLTPWMGRRVRLTWQMDSADFVTWMLDDVGLTQVPTDLGYSVWMASGLGQPMELLGWTPSPFFPLQDLAPSREYQWRVDLHQDGVVHTGPIWGFQTEVRRPLSQVRVGPLPEILCAGNPLLLPLQVTDENGFGGGPSDFLPDIQLVGDGVKPPRVVVSELDPVYLRAEFQNLTEETVDLSGWQVGVVHVDDTSSPRIRLTVPNGSFLAPGAMFQVHLNAQAPSQWPILRVPATSLWRAGGRAGGVILRDADGAVVDCVFHQASAAFGSRITTFVPWSEWPGLGVEGSIVDGWTFQRLGDRDSNEASNWRRAIATLGFVNADLASRLLPGRGTLPVTFPAVLVRSDSLGRINLPVQWGASGSGVQIRAVLKPPGTTPAREGHSGPHSLSSVCLAMTVVPTLLESAGTVSQAVTVALTEPVAQDTRVELMVWGAAVNDLILPGSLVIPAGAREASASVQVVDDSLYNGPRSLQWTAWSEGLPEAHATTVVEDDETATLTLEVPSELTEGTTVESVLKIQPPPSRRVEIELISSDPGRLILSADGSLPGRCVVDSGVGQVPIRFQSVPNEWLEGPTRVPVSARLGRWTTGEATAVITDDETRTLAVALEGFLAETTDPQPLRIRLGGKVEQDVAVTLDIDPSDRLQAPGPVVCPAGQSSVVVMLVPINDGKTNGNVQLTLTARSEGWEAGSTRAMFLDDDPARFRVRVPKSPLSRDELFSVQVTAETIDGMNLGGDIIGAGVYSALDEQGQAVALAVDAGPQFRVTEFRPWVRIRYDALGASGISEPILMWNTPAPRDLTAVAYDRVRDRLLLASAGVGVLRVHPESGAREALDPPVTEVLQMAVEADHLFLQAFEQRRLTRVNLSNWTVDASWEPTGDFGPAGFVWVSLIPLESSPGSILVALQSLEVGEKPGEVEWVVYDGAVPRPQRLHDIRRGFITLNPSRIAGEVIAMDGTTLRRLKVTAEGVEEITDDVFPYVREAFPFVWMGPFELLQSQPLLRTGSLFPLFFTTGPSGTSTVAADPVHGRVAWCLGSDQFRILEPLTLKEVWHSEGGLVSENLNPSLVWAGPHRWARIGSGILNLHRDAAPEPGRAADLRISGDVIVRTPETARAGVRLRVQNLGATPVTDVRLTLGLQAGVSAEMPGTLLVRFPDGGATATNVLGERNYLLGTLAPGETRELTPEFQAASGGTLRLAAIVGSDSADPDPSDNLVVASDAGLEPPLPVGLIPSAVSGESTGLLTFPAVMGWYYGLERSRSVSGPWEPLPRVYAIETPMGVPVELPEGGATYWRVRPWP